MTTHHRKRQGRNGRAYEEAKAAAGGGARRTRRHARRKRQQAMRDKQQAGAGDVHGGGGGAGGHAGPAATRGLATTPLPPGARQPAGASRGDPGPRAVGDNGRRPGTTGSASNARGEWRQPRSPRPAPQPQRVRSDEQAAREPSRRPQADPGRSPRLSGGSATRVAQGTSPLAGGQPAGRRSHGQPQVAVTAARSAMVSVATHNQEAAPGGAQPRSCPPLLTPARTRPTRPASRRTAAAHGASPPSGPPATAPH